MNKRGAIIQMACTIILLLLFGISTYILVAAGYGSFNRMTISQDEYLNTRVAMNYLSMHIRRSDAAGSVRIDSSAQGTCLVLSEDVEGENYETRIYLYNGYLQESFVPSETPFNEENGFEIIQLDSFAIKRENNVIEIELSSGVNRRSMKLMLNAG
jgi:hypothetical protein